MSEESKETPFGSAMFELEDRSDIHNISEDWPLECALRLENHLSLNFKHGKPYNDKGRSLVFNLTDEKNPKVRLALLHQEVTPEQFLKMDIRQLASDELKM